MAWSLRTREITGAQPGNHLLITGGVHGDEFEPMAAIRRLADEIDPSRLHGTVTLVPVVNGPAFVRGQRCGDDGLDLARTCPGRADGSVTEQIAAALSERIRAADYYIDLHTGGTRLTVLPLVGYTLHPAPEVLADQRRMARAFGLRIIWGTDPNLEGRSLSVARDAQVPAIYGEYLGGGRFEPQGVSAYVHGCLNVMRELGFLEEPVWPPAEDVVQVEDERPGAGHMQVNHPVPFAGFFEPLVHLGQWVRAGDLLGTVCDETGERRANVSARYDGIVIVLHTFSRVDAETSVAVIMEIKTRSEIRP